MFALIEILKKQTAEKLQTCSAESNFSCLTWSKCSGFWDRNSSAKKA